MPIVLTNIHRFLHGHAGIRSVVRPADLQRRDFLIRVSLLTANYGISCLRQGLCCSHLQPVKYGPERERERERYIYIYIYSTYIYIYKHIHVYIYIYIPRSMIVV